MCTVSLIARKQGYLLGMNRDEQLTRAKGLPPALRVVDGVKILCPSEPAGGTWIALNDTGVTFALINWYSIRARVAGQARSRGEVVSSVSPAGSPAVADARLARLTIDQINPFRLIGVFPVTREVVEWRWSLKQFARQNHCWETRQWISSGFDEPTAQRVRGKTFHEAKAQASTGSLDWLRRLHRSHRPGTGPFSTCMHRVDAATVSYTEVAFSSRRAAMRHCVGAPCQSSSFSIHRLSMQSPGTVPSEIFE